MPIEDVETFCADVQTKPLGEREGLRDRDALLTNKDNRLTALLASGKSNADLVTELYWTALSRPPGTSEAGGALDLLDQAPDKRIALEDVTWALLNTKEFVLRK